MSGQIWSIGLAFGASPLALRVPDSPILTKADITDVAADFVADPFLIRLNQSWHLFFEIWNRNADKGEIGHAQSADLRHWTYDGIVLREPWHLSYPHVFEHGGEIWMTPESTDAGGVHLYRAASFPHRWHDEGVLVPGALADPSPLFWQGNWYLFACPSFEKHDDLTLFTSAQLDGGWRPHPAGLLRTADVRGSRPAGRLLNDEGRLLRWAQDCYPQYGTAVRAFEILELNPERYRERELPESPVLVAGGDSWRHGGMHHIDAHRLPDDDRAGWGAAVDGFYVEAQPDGCEC
ncbi:glucosamine inositolphosphorylceramide transferase family protein [Paludibacterium purpuratum]|uniref:Glucosamine inositolphosphorylceramide transferase 1 N-terminal domain-containing protein n=1 Tax=Paludibacterium purpuratum TaxID=1144873 RepID=A0A4R7B0F1_9NEIS|nr:hypothetical protein [Paludibacterium purpuratum]TDR73904.1 hypothetical protein DFP86_112108 [Paludibacterium purpuratum]